MTILSNMQGVLGIRPEERKLVWFAFFVFFWGGTGRALTSSASYAAFLAQFGGDFIPYIYIVTGTVMVVIMAVYLRLSARVSLRRALVANLGLATALTAAFSVWLALNPSPVVVFALPVWHESFCVMLPLALWSLAGQLFTVRQGKRLFGLVGSGIPAGFIVGGLLTRGIAPTFGSVGLLTAATVCIALALLMTATAPRVFPDRFAMQVVDHRSAQPVAARNLWRSHYVLLIFGILICWTLAFFLVDNIFLERVSARFGTETEVATFMGIYSMVRGVLMLLGGLWLTGPLLNRFGVRIGLLVLPAVLALSIAVLIVPGVIWGLIPFLFWPALATKVLNYTFDSVDRSARSILYQPLPIDVRLRVQTVAEGIVQPVMTGVAGILLLVLTGVLGFSVIQLGIALLGVLTGWIAVGLLAGRAYPAMLMAALLRRRLDGTVDALGDGSSRLVLQQALRSPHADVVIYSLRQLATTQDVVPALVDLLDHPQPALRLEALARLERSAAPSLWPVVERRLAVEGDPQVRGALFCTAVALDAAHAFDAAVAALADPSPAVREGAAIGLLRYGETKGVLAAGSRLQSWVAAPAPADRISAARVLGAGGSGDARQSLVTLLTDDDPGVRCAAIAAAGCLHHVRLWPFVIAALGVPETAQAAVAALAAGGDAVLPAIGVAWGEATTDEKLDLRLAQVCASIRTPAATALLAGQLTNGATPGVDMRDGARRDAVLSALQRCGYEADVVARAAVYALVKQEGSLTAWVTAAQVDLGKEAGAGANTALALLWAALANELAGQRGRVLRLLAFVADGRAVRRSQEILNAPQATPDQRAYAQELLDLVTPQELKTVVLTLIDDLTPQARLQRLQLLYPQGRHGATARLYELAVVQDGRLQGWTVACALAALDSSGCDDHAPFAVAATATDLLVRETATWLCARRQAGIPSAILAAAGHPAQEKTMLSTLERVIILKSASIFGAVPDNLLVAVAVAAEEVALRAGDQLFAKGDLGQEMYVIVSGHVRIHDGAHTLNQLGAYEVFGEMALLDAEPRSASVTASEETLLLRLRQEEFFELLDEHGAIARGVIRVLSQRLRDRSAELAALRAA